MHNFENKYVFVLVLFFFFLFFFSYFLVFRCMCVFRAAFCNVSHFTPPFFSTKFLIIIYSRISEILCTDISLNCIKLYWTEENDETADENEEEELKKNLAQSKHANEIEERKTF